MTKPSKNNSHAISCHPALESSQNAQATPHDNVITNSGFVVSFVHDISSIESGDLTFVRSVQQDSYGVNG